MLTLGILAWLHLRLDKLRAGLVSHRGSNPFSRTPQPVSQHQYPTVGRKLAAHAGDIARMAVAGQAARH